MALNANVVLLRSTVRGGRATLRFNGTSANCVVQANSTVNADIADAGHATDQIVGATISGIWWSITGNTTIADGAVTVQRQANTILTLSGVGSWSPATGWLGDGQFPAANVVVTFSGAAQGTVYVEFAKQYQNGSGNVIE